MKFIKYTLLIAVLTLTITLQAEKSAFTEPNILNLGSVEKSKTIEQDWINGLLAGKDMTPVSRSYSQQLKQSATEIKNQNKIIRGNNYLENFSKRYNDFVDDITKLEKLDKALGGKQWENKVTYLKRSYERAKRSQQDLLTYLKNKEQFLQDKLSDSHNPVAKIELIQDLIEQTSSKLSENTHKLLNNKSIKKFAQQKDWHDFLKQQKVKHKKILRESNSKSVDTLQNKKILRNNSLPYAGREYFAPILQYTPEITPSYADQNAQAATSVDLADGVVVQLSTEVRQLGADLGHDYIKIYNYVRQNIKLQYYAGAQKGSDATLRSHAGNDIDQAALLMGLLRVSNVPARFVHGVIRQPIDEAMIALGISNANEVLEALNRAGIAYTPVIEGGQVTAIHRQYTWVSAYVPYANYRGSAGDLSERAWIPLAPAIKQEYQSASDYDYQSAGINSDSLIIDYLTTSNNQSPLLFWKNQVQSDISNNYPNLNYEELLNRHQNETASYRLLPSSLPFTVIANTGESAQLDSQYIQSLTLQLGENAEFLDITILLPEIAGKRLTLSYSPATVDDQNIINQAGGMGLVEPYLIDLRPVIKLDGKQQDSLNSTLPMASNENLKLIFNSPGGSETFIRNTLIGNYLTLVVTTQNDNYPLDTEDDNVYADETKPTRIMHNLAKIYNQKWTEAENEMAAIMDVALIKAIPSLAIISPEFKLLQTQGLITEMKFKGVSIDAVSRSVDAISHIAQDKYDFYRLSSLHGSYLESNIFQTQWAVDAISADKGLRKLTDTGSLLHLTPADYQAQLAATNHPQYVKDEIADQLNQGHHAILVESEDNIDIWTGSSWHIYDPQTGYSGYFISGIYAGGQSTQDPEAWDSIELFSLLANPYEEGSNFDPLSANSITIIDSTNFQTGVVDELLELPLAVIVRDEFNKPVYNALVTFAIKGGETTLISADVVTGTIITSKKALSVVTDAFGVAKIFIELDKKISLNIKAFLNPEDVNLTRIGVTNVTATVASHFGEIEADDFFQFFALPGEADQIELIDCFVKGWECPEDGAISHFGTMGAVMHYRVIDAFENNVSNVPVDIDAVAGSVAFSPQIALKENCNEMSIFAPDCAEALVNTQSNYFWSTFFVYNGLELPGTYDILVSSSNPNLDSKNANVQSWEDSSFDFWSDIFVYKGLFLMGPYGKFEAGKPSSSMSLKRLYFESPGSTNPSENYNLERFKLDSSGYRPNSSVAYSSFDVTSSDSNASLSINDSGYDSHSVQLPSNAQRMDFDIKLEWENDSDESKSVTIGDWVYAATVAVTDVQPQEFSLNPKNHSKTPILVTAEVLPVTYNAESAIMRFFENGVEISEHVIEYPGSEMEFGFPDIEIDLTAVYEAQITLNEGTEFEIKSDIAQIDGFTQQIVSRVTCENTDESFTGSSCGGRVVNNRMPSGYLLTSIDFADPLVCRHAGLTINLNTDSKISLELEKYDRFGNLTGDVTSVVSNESHPAGEVFIFVTADELGTGQFLIRLDATSDDTGETENIEGQLKSVLKIKHSFAMGHTIVQGVDLADGSMAYSTKDISLQAPGVNLDFVRTYSNKSRYELGPLGYGWSYNYMSRVQTDNCGRIYVSGAAGGISRFRYLGADIVPLKGTHSTLLSNSDGSFSFYTKNGTHYHYSKRQNQAWWLDFIEDTNGNQLTIETEDFNFTPILKSVTDSAGRKLIYNYSTMTFVGKTGQVLTNVTGPNGIVLDFTYDIQGHLLTAKREGDTVNETYEYSTEVFGLNQNLLKKITNNDTLATREYVYSDKIRTFPTSMGVFTNIEEKQVDSIIEKDAGTTIFNYTEDDGGYNDIVNIDQNSVITEYMFNEHGSATSVITPYGTKTMEWEFVNEILLKSETDEEGRVKSFEYDEFANIKKLTIDDISTSYVYNSDVASSPPYIKDQIKSYSNWNDYVTTYEYDEKGNKTKETFASKNIIYEPDSKGLVISQTDRRGKITNFTYDVYGQLDSVTDPVGNVVTTEWDTRNRKVLEVDANGNTRSFTYDDSDRILIKTLNAPAVNGQIVLPEIKWQYSYEAGGLIMVESNPRGYDTTSTFDTLGRLLNKENPYGNNYTYILDDNGNKISENDFRGLVTTYTYDLFNRLESKTDPESNIYTYTYDNVGHVLSETVAGRQNVYTYDPRRYFMTSETVSDVSSASIEIKTVRDVDGEGNVIQKIDPNNNISTYSYDKFNQLITESGPLGFKRTVSYDGNGNILSEIADNVVAGSGVVEQKRTYTYDDDNRRITFTDTEGDTVLYTYDDNDNLTSEKKQQGYIVTFDYNALNLVIGKSESRGSEAPAIWVNEYDVVGNKIRETLPNNNIITTIFDKLNRIESQADLIGSLSAFTYDESSNIITEKDGNGTAITYEYNNLNQRISEIKLLDRSHAYTYNVFGELESDIGPNGALLFEYNTIGQNTGASGPEGFNEVYVHDANNNQVSLQDSRGNITNYLINALDQTYQQDTLSSDGLVIFSKSFNHDTVGNIISELDYNSIESTFEFDKENRLLHYRKDTKLQKTTVYNSAGLVQSETDANGNTRVHTYNNQYNRTKTVLPENQIVQYTSDAFGNVTFQNNPGLNDMTRVFDKRHRLISERNGVGEMTLFEYDLNDNRTAEIKPDGTRWEYLYDVANRLTRIRNTVENIDTVYDYDNRDNMISVTDAELKVTTFEFNNRNEKIAKHYPGGADVMFFSYDENSNLKTVDFPNGTHIVYEYDVLNRKINEGYSGPYGSGSVTYTLDLNGNTLQISENINGRNYSTIKAYDGLERIISNTDVYGNNYQFTYDANGNKKTFKDYNNVITTYAYDGLDRLATMSKVGLGTFDWSYNSAGLVSNILYPNAASVEYIYDSASRIASVTNKKSGADITSHLYEYDLNGNRVKLTESNINVNQVINYGYDKADRLTNVEYPAQATTYTLDKVGNRVSEVVTGTSPLTKTYSYNDRDQLTFITDTSGSSISYIYDDAGNQIEKNDNGVKTIFDYSARHRVKTITIGAGNPINYQYDFSGQRINYQSNGIEKRYLYDGLTLIAETNTLGNTLARYHYGGSYQLAESRNDINSYYHVDALGTNVAVTNQDGSIQARYEYDAYGNQLTQAGSSDIPFGFTGYQKDNETGLYYANARYYDSATARFLREDPADGNINNTPSLHRYMYANGNPNKFLDPSGKFGVFFDGTWNNQANPDENIYKTITNVAKIERLYNGPKRYIDGVGTDWYTSLVGGLTGAGIDNRLEAMYGELVEEINANKHLKVEDPDAWKEMTSLDIFGFSRGSATAIAFTNLINERGIPDTDSKKSSDFFSIGEKYEKNIEGINIRFLGIFDTVASVGIPGNDIDFLNLKVDPDKVAQTSHAMMINENRGAFPVISLDDINQPKIDNIKQRWFLGAHSNGGGGYGFVVDEEATRANATIVYKMTKRAGKFSTRTKTRIPGKEVLMLDQGKENKIADLTLAWMIGEAINAGAPVSKLTGMQGLIPMFEKMSVEEIRRNYVHDSKGSALYIFDWGSTTRKVISPYKGSSVVISETQLINFWKDQKAVILEEASDGIQGK